jgi:hypothetical protein
MRNPKKNVADLKTKISLARIVCASLFVVFGFHLSACTATPPQVGLAPDAAKVSVRQFIVKFKPDTLPCSAAGIARLSMIAKARLEYVRPMSDDACVIRLFGQNAADFIKSEQRIRQHPAIEWMEPDAVMKAF